MQYRARDM